MSKSETTQMQFIDTDMQCVLGRNTFRRGDKYASLRPEQSVEATNEEGDVTTTLIVKSVHIGLLSDMLDEFSETNHSVFEARRDRRKGPGDHPAAGRLWLHKRLDDFYDDLKDTEVFTVIEFAEDVYETKEIASDD